MKIINKKTYSLCKKKYILFTKSTKRKKKTTPLLHLMLTQTLLNIRKLHIVSGSNKGKNRHSPFFILITKYFQN